MTTNLAVALHSWVDLCNCTSGAHLHTLSADSNGTGPPQVPYKRPVAATMRSLPRQICKKGVRLAQRHIGRHPFQQLQGIQIPSCRALHHFTSLVVLLRHAPYRSSQESRPEAGPASDALSQWRTGTT